MKKYLLILVALLFTPLTGSVHLSTDNFLSLGVQRAEAFSSDCTGGTITHVGGNTIHTFTTSGTLTCTSSGTANYLVVAGGGGGGGGGSPGVGGSGGGGGGRLAGSAAVSATAYSIVVGTGGGGGAVQNSGTQGVNSTALGVTAVGGGFGSTYGAPPTGNTNVGGNGGSGGGGNYAAGGSPTSGQGYAGGSGSAGGYNNAGGGGAGAVGGDGSSSNPVGGAGLSSSISGSTVYYAGGGGGGAGGGSSSAAGGNGGGGAGCVSGSPGTAGTVNTGGGGGGGCYASTAGGAGGSGIVIVSYLTPSPPPTTECTGGTITRVGGNTIHTFTSSGTFTCTAAGGVNYLVVAGGGGGGGAGAGAGAGGAGGMLTGTTAVIAQAYSITVGAGGNGVTATTYSSAIDNGSDSVFSSITATGGGGGSSGNVAGGNGGSGGGGGGGYNSAAGTGTGGQGNNGGAGTSSSPCGNTYCGGGGGGAGTAGTAGAGGGNGLASSISGSSVTYAGGGGGGTYTGGTAGTGGTGGGGSGGVACVNGTNGTANTGGGGGGAGGYGCTTTGGNGGSGVVIVSYSTPASATPPTTECTGGTITRVGGNTIHTFTSSGTFTCTAAGGVNYLVVAGGGGGSTTLNYSQDSGSGAGGAGGMLTGTLAITAQAYTITVGAGGARGVSGGGQGGNGGNSIFSTVTSSGGGGGGWRGVGSAGGSGGGGASYPGLYGGGAGTAGQGNIGGQSVSTTGGGGGGANAAAGNQNGGNGTASSISGSSVTYAGGGGGGKESSGTAGTGGTGGGGGGGVGNTSNGADGTPNTGGGGGGAGAGSIGPQLGGLGGSGIVIMSYATPAGLYLGSTVAPAYAKFKFVGGYTKFKGGAIKYGYYVPSIPAIIDPYWSNVVLLLHMDGANGGTTFTDSSASAKTVTPTNAITSTTQIKYGSASGSFNGTNAKLTLPTSSDLSLTGDFTIEFWMYPSAITGKDVIGKANNGIYWDTGGYFYIMGAGSYLNTAASFGTANTWQFISVVRVGSTVTLYKNGVLVPWTGGSLTTQTVDLSAATIGYGNYGGYFNGYIDDLRITKGIARYTGNFTPPALAYPNVGNTGWAVWNPGDKSSVVTLSGGNLTTTLSSGSAYQSVRSTLSKSSGKWYWEVKAAAAATLRVAPGIANASAGIQNLAIGNVADATGYAYFGNSGSISYNASNIATYATFALGDTFGLALDASTGYTQFYKNNVLQGIVTSSVTGPYFPSLTLYDSDANVTTNFGQNPLAYTPPNGTFWNPKDAGAGAGALANNNLTTTTPSSAYTVRTNTGKSAGKFYAEVTYTGTDRHSMIGVANASAALTNYLGVDANGWCYYAYDGTKISSNSGTAYGATFIAGDVIGIALDMTNGRVFFSKNGVWQNSGDPVGGTSYAYNGLSGTLMLAFGSVTPTSSQGGTLNTGVTPFAYSPPTGYSAWDSTVYSAGVY